MIGDREQGAEAAAEAVEAAATAADVCAWVINYVHVVVIKCHNTRFELHPTTSASGGW